LFKCEVTEGKSFAIQYDKFSRKKDCSSLFLRVIYSTVLSVADAVLHTTFGFRNKYNTSVEIHHICFLKQTFCFKIELFCQSTTKKSSLKFILKKFVYVKELHI